MIFERTRLNTPEEHLGFAILSRAVADLFIGDNYHGNNQDVIRREALVFLTDKDGQWAQSRADFCTLCGVDPSLLRDRVIDILEGRAPPDLGEARKAIKLDLAQRLWREMSKPSPDHKARQESADRRRAYLAKRDAVFDYLSEPRKWGEMKSHFGFTGNQPLRRILTDLEDMGAITRVEIGLYGKRPETPVEAA